jgi:hypothetical protein
LIKQTTTIRELARGTSGGILPSTDPRSFEPSPVSDRADSRVDVSVTDVSRAEGARRERWMEWAEMDLEELLAANEGDDDGDPTDRHWKKGNQPTASGFGHQKEDHHDTRPPTGWPASRTTAPV